MQGRFSVETRLPNENSSQIQGMAFYYQNREYYTEAVKEFTSFLCYGSFWRDIIGGSTHLVDRLQIAPIPRFDNLLLYSTEQGETKLYKIGIIDLETFQLNSPKPEFHTVYKAVSTSSQIFPYHFDAIIEQSKIFCELSEQNIQALRTESLKSLQLYKIVCEDNLSFYQRHNITLQNQMAITLSDARKEELKQQIGSFVLNMHENPHSYHSECLNGDPAKSVKRFQEELFPKMIALVEDELKDLFTQSSKSKLPRNYGKLIERRMENNGVTCDLAMQLKANEKKSDNLTLVKEIFGDSLVPYFDIFKEILNQLVIGGELSYYKAHVYSSDDLIFF